MEEEKMLVPSRLKTVDGKDIMCYTGAFYLKNEEKIKRIIKKCEEILDAEDKNREESENIMMNAARIINREIRKQRREGREEGIAEGMIFVAKKLKGKMHIKDISQITGLSEKEIEKL